MTLDLRDVSLSGPALPEPFVRFELAGLLARLGLLPPSNPALEQTWSKLRRTLGGLGGSGGPQRVHNHVIAALADSLGFARPIRQQQIATREGPEDGGWLLRTPDGASLRAWSVSAGVDLEAPNRRGSAYRFSPTRSAQRVLLAAREPAGLLTNGETLRLLLCDPARPDSRLEIALAGERGWRMQALAPDSYRLLLSLVTPAGLRALPEILEAARHSQARVTKDLRVQARAAVEGFLQGVLDHPANAALRPRDASIAARLWADGLVLVYRLLFILKLESESDTARAFSFASTRLWRTALSPNRALGPLVRAHLDHGHDTGRMLEDGLRAIFRAFRDGLACAELSIAPLGGALFGECSAPLLDQLAWGERAVARLLDKLLWTTPKDRGRERVHYGALDVEELGRIYEALLELEPGIAKKPMMRLRRAKLEAVVPAAPSRDRHVEDIPPGRFYLRAGFGRKATGSYYTPHGFVRFLVQETLGPLVKQRSPDTDPNPAAILDLKVLDPAAGSGHFLVETCRFLGEALYAACRLCDEQAASARRAAAEAQGDERARLIARAELLSARIANLPEPNLRLLAYLPARACEGAGSGLSQSRALAICRRLVAVHCLYGVDRNPLAAELAKLSLWLESYAEGLPLTFLDHRLVRGDSLAGPSFARLATLPVSGGPLDPLLAHGVMARLSVALQSAMDEVRALEASIGEDAADLALKEGAKARLDAVLHPLRRLAAAWAGAMMLATREADDEWLALARYVADEGVWPGKMTRRQAALCEAGALALAWDLTFPEVFRPDSAGTWTRGFDAVLGNPPWDIVQPKAKDFLASFDLSILDAPTKREALAIETRLLAEPAVAAAYRQYQDAFAHLHRAVARLYAHQHVKIGGAPTGGKLDAFRVFAERALQLAGPEGAIGLVVPSAFHANEGATGVRQLYLRETRLQWCLSFENRRKLFEIDSRFKFALIVARRPGPTESVRCGFYLTDLADIQTPDRLVDLTPALIEASGGPYATFPELRGAVDVRIASRMFTSGQTFGAWTQSRGLHLSREAHMSDDAGRFTPWRGASKRRLLPLHEGKTIHQFTDSWHPPRYGIAASALADRPQFQENARYFRAACREIASSTNERTAIAAMLPPRVICGHTLNVERSPALRPNAAALTLTALINSFAFDWLLRQRSSSHVSLFILSDIAVPDLLEPMERFLAHGALRLSCNHEGFWPLWQEQLGSAWREKGPRFSWPVLAEETARWTLRSASDAVVAQAFGLSAEDYAHILQSFSHKSFPEAPAMCLRAFEQVAKEGLAAFCQAHDPYADIALPTGLARPCANLKPGC
ncbi:MAG: hypothetical protein JO227_05165 [Acetobacteraceae bacterium]|nr:hypothetical protein [Acetobacteraceae bacterium]